MRCKPPCMAWVTRCAHPENKNRIVMVHTDSHQGPRGHMWKVTCGEPMKGVNMDTGIPGDDSHRWEALWCYDADLTPINDPGIDTKDVEKKKDWSFPKENEHA